MRHAAIVTTVGLATLLAGASSGTPTQASASPNAIETDQSSVSRFFELPGAQLVSPNVWQLPTEQIVPPPQPFEALSLEQLHEMLTRTPSLLGTASVGSPNRGRLLNAVQLRQAPFWKVLAPQRAWGTPELIECLERVVSSVHDEHPGHPLFIGDLSLRDGGYLRSHRSHQSGRDADIGYYYVDDVPWYTKATNKTLDVKRTWALVRALMTDCNVEYLFTDMRVQAMLREHAEATGEDSEWLDWLFARGRGKPGIIRHAWGHLTHIHVRVHAPDADALGQRVQMAQLWARMRRPSAWSRR